MTGRSKGQARVVLLLLVAVVVQTSVVSNLRVDRVAPDLMLLLAVCSGIYGGARQGVLVGFACGLLSDLFLTGTPLGLSALTFCLVGYVVGAIRATLVPEGWLLVPLLCCLASAAGVVGFLVIGDLVGQTQLLSGGRAFVVRTVLIESVANTVLCLPVAWTYERCCRGTEGAEEIRRGAAEGIMR